MQAHELTKALGGKWYGRYGVAFCPAHPNTNTPALRLADGEGGRLLALCSAGCRFGDIAAELRGRGLQGSGNDFRARMMQGKSVSPSHTDAARLERARKSWASAGPISGTLAERYLRARHVRGPLPEALRFDPDAWHPTGRRLPTMMAEVRLGCALVGVHRTYLAEPSVKAATEPAKAMLGPCGGGAVRLSDGSGPLVVGEGIETMLTLRDARSSARCWAALSTSGVAGLRLPETVGELIIAPDGDAPGRTAADKLAHRAHALGWRVSVLDPPGDGLDWNDWARGMQHG